MSDFLFEKSVGFDLFVVCCPMSINGREVPSQTIVLVNLYSMSVPVNVSTAREKDVMRRAMI